MRVTAPVRGKSGLPDDWLMLSAHMDTVGKDTGIKPQIRDGVIYSDGITILGGDDKSGVAVILETIRAMQDDELPHPPLEVVISVGEEVSLRGAKLLDKSKLRARRGYVLDAAGRSGPSSQRPARTHCEMDGTARRLMRGANRKGINAIRVASEPSRHAWGASTRRRRPTWNHRGGVAGTSCPTRCGCRGGAQPG
jgi:tripeptide aminopeptidase